MKPEAGFSWEAGEHGIFKLSNRKVKGKKWRVFSVASVPKEGVMTIGTRTGKDIFSFKKELISMKEGDKVSIRGPFGWFKIQDSTSPMVMVAGGVGITPIRALIKQLEKDSARPVELVYSSSDYHLFDDEIQAVALGNKKITIYKTNSSEETRSALATLVDNYKGEAYYFVSGSQAFIGGIKEQITETGVKGKRVIRDPFIGY
jgi:ferredoxin-NADP reductase